MDRFDLGEPSRLPERPEERTIDNTDVARQPKQHFPEDYWTAPWTTATPRGPICTDHQWPK